MFKEWNGPSLVLLHSASISIWWKSLHSTSEPFLPAEMFGKWLNHLRSFKNIMLVTKIIKIGPMGPHLALRASKKPYSIAKIAKTFDPFLTIEWLSRCLGNHSKRQGMLKNVTLGTKLIKIRPVLSGKSLFPNICALLLVLFFTSRAAAESYVGVGGGGGGGRGDVLLFCVWMPRKAYKKYIKACKSV